MYVIKRKEYMKERWRAVACRTGNFAYTKRWWERERAKQNNQIHVIKAVFLRFTANYSSNYFGLCHDSVEQMKLKTKYDCL